MLAGTVSIEDYLIQAQTNLCRMKSTRGGDHGVRRACVGDERKRSLRPENRILRTACASKGLETGTFPFSFIGVRLV